ncbi:MAG: alkaline phytoceramidase, partial [Phototrophicales bacterium]
MSLHSRIVELRYRILFGMIILIGIGSVAFHATLKFHLQMLDELPMLWCALVNVYIFLEDGKEVRRHGLWLPISLTLLGIVETLLTSMSHGAFQFYLFHLSFSTSEWYCIYRMYKLYKKGDDNIRRIYLFGLRAFLLAVVCWLIDLLLCHHIQTYMPMNPQLHAAWHVLASVAFYLLTMSIAYDRLKDLKREPTIKWLFSFLPYIQV